MFVLLAIVIGLLFACGIYLMLRRNIVRMIFGLVLIGHAANLLIFDVAGLVRANPPLVAEGAVAPAAGHADPLPQALVLTAIVISFALVAFASVLIQRVYLVTGHDDPDELRESER